MNISFHQRIKNNMKEIIYGSNMIWGNIEGMGPETPGDHFYTIKLNNRSAAEIFVDGYWKPLIQENWHGRWQVGWPHGVSIPDKK